MSRRSNHLYEFGPFRLDAAERLLSRYGETVPLPPKAFDLLLALIDHHGHLIEKDELLKAVWPDTFVEEVNLSYNVSLIRKALGEGENGQRFIETVPKRGYRFVGDVREMEESATATTEEPPGSPATPGEAVRATNARNGRRSFCALVFFANATTQKPDTGNRHWQAIWRLSQDH